MLTKNSEFLLLIELNYFLKFLIRAYILRKNNVFQETKIVVEKLGIKERCVRDSQTRAPDLGRG